MLTEPTKTDAVDDALRAEESRTGSRVLAYTEPVRIAESLGVSRQLVQQRMVHHEFTSAGAPRPQIAAMLLAAFPDRWIRTDSGAVDRIATHCGVLRQTVNAVARVNGFKRQPRAMRHGTLYQYRQGCKCDECTVAAQAKWRRDYHRRHSLV